ncbi:MAG: ribonuclease P [Candidatus Micrarchaeota archaeon]
MNLDQIASRRCGKLLKMAAEIYDSDKALSKRYVQLARRIAMRHRIPLGSKLFCKKCSTIFIHGKTLKVRIAPSKKAVIFICNNCKAEKKYPYSRRKA